MVIKKNIIYRIVLILNGEYKKLLFETKERIDGYEIFRKLIKENEKIILPKKFINKKGINPCKYGLYLLKSFGPDSEVDENKIYNGKWKILQYSDFNIEETFFLFGYDSRYERKDIFDIVKYLLINKSKIREVLIVKNKLLIYNDDIFDMVICKCEKDAKRLNSTLYTLLNKFKSTKFIFLGLVTKNNLSYMYDIIEEETGWNRIKVMRSTTSP